MKSPSPAPRAKPRRARPLELTGDMRAGDARATIYSNARVFIENHSGIIEFDGSHVRVGTRRASLIVIGENLIIDSCEGRALIVRGQILRLELESRGDAHDGK